MFSCRGSPESSAIRNSKTFAKNCVLSCLPNFDDIKKKFRVVFELWAPKAVIRGILSRYYCCYGNLCHENGNNVFTKDWATRRLHESEEWSSQLIFQFKQLERRSLKKSGLQRDSNPWLPRYRGAMLYQLSYEATHWERGQLIEFISSREEWNDVNRYRGGHGFESRWSPDFFRLLLCHCLNNWKINCDDHSSLSSTTEA